MKTNCINLLMIGNSFAYNTVDHLIELAKIYGVKLEVGVLFIGGCSIDTHYENFINGNKNYEFRYITNEKDEVTFNYSIQEALDFKKWENISFQQASHYSGVKDTYKNLKELMRLIRENSNANFIWLNTWAYSKVSAHPLYNLYNFDQEYMHSKIIETLEEVVKKECGFSIIIPAGIVIQKLRELTNLDNYNLDDGFHLNSLGCFVAGLCLIKTMLYIDLNSNKLPKTQLVKTIVENVNKVS